MKSRVFSSRGSRFVNADGQYTVREEQDSRPRIYENDEGMEVVEEDKFSHIVNSFTYSKKPRKNERWTIEDTELFFKVLGIFYLINKLYFYHLLSMVTCFYNIG